jgi:hypothetical protein
LFAAPARLPTQRAEKARFDNPGSFTPFSSAGQNPTQNIVWVAPEGGGGPNYPNM